MISLRTLLLSTAGLLFASAPGWSQVIVIANPSVKTSSASRTDVKEIFSGASSSLKDGSHVTPVLHRPGPVQDEFVATYLGKSDSAFRAAWRTLVFSGQAGMPRSLDSDSAIVAYVAHNPGALGYIDSTSSHEGVKVLVVQ